MQNDAPFPPPAAEEKTLALLAHVLQIFTWWIGPLVIYLAKRESKFSSFHAVQALLWQVTLMVLGGAGFALWFFIFFASVLSRAGGPEANQPPPPAFFVLFPILWLGFFAAWIANVVLGIVFGIRAGRGEWAEYPLLGRWARRIVNT